MPILTIRNVPLHYDETINRGKRSLILAGPLLFEAFDTLLPLLEDHFHLVHLDVHGHRRSGLRIPGRLEEMPHDFYDLLTRLDLSAPVWVGHSIGGMLGMRMAC